MFLNNKTEGFIASLFVFWIGGPKQNSGSLLIPLSETFFFLVMVVILLSMVAFSTIFRLVEILPIRVFEIREYFDKKFNFQFLIVTLTSL